MKKKANENNLLQDRLKGLKNAERQLEILWEQLLLEKREHERVIRMMVIWHGEKFPPEGNAARLYRFTTVEAAKQALSELFDLNALGYDVYTGVNLRTRPSGDKEAEGEVWRLHLQIDVRKGMSAEEAEARARFPFPSFLLMSLHPTGGRYWFVDGGQALPDELAGLMNRAIAKALEMEDAVNDVSPHIRLAGTVNHRAACRGLPPARTQLIVEEEEE